jgi:hypothetical protein
LLRYYLIFNLFFLFFYLFIYLFCLLILSRSITCCSARPRKLFPEHTEKEKDKESSGRESPTSGSSVNNTNMSEDVWLECDDEVIRVLRMRELEDLLSRKPRTSALTPYLLFYVQVKLNILIVKTQVIRLIDHLCTIFQINQSGANVK